MFLREKRIGAYSYVYLVETVREDGTTKQRIIQNLGRKEVVEARGDLDRLARSAARFAQRSMVLSVLDYGGASALRCCLIGCGARPAAGPLSGSFFGDGVSSSRSSAPSF